MSQWVYGSLLTGQILGTLQVTEGTWSVRLNQPDEITCKVPTNDPDMQALNLKSTLQAGKTFIAVLNGSTVLSAGIIWSSTYEMANRKLSISASGLMSYFYHRLVLPASAQAGNSVSGYDTSYSNISYGSMAVALVNQTTSWTNGFLPLDLPSSGITDSGKSLSIKGTDLAVVGDELTKLINQNNGPDIRFKPYFSATSAGTFIRWSMTVGTPTDPYVYADTAQTWTLGLPESTIKSLNILSDGGNLASYGYATGGSQSGNIYSYKSNNLTTLSAGYPVLEIIDSAHQSATSQTQVQGFADNLVAQGVSPYETWSFEVQSDRVPTVGSYYVGDFIRVNVVKDEFIPTGIYVQRIVSYSGDAIDKFIKIDCVPKR
jgi:hypothetical protein